MSAHLDLVLNWRYLTLKVDVTQTKTSLDYAGIILTFILTCHVD